MNSRNLTGSQERSVWWILPSSGATWSLKSRAVSWPPNTQPTSKTSVLRHFTALMNSFTSKLKSRNTKVQYATCYNYHLKSSVGRFRGDASFIIITQKIFGISAFKFFFCVGDMLSYVIYKIQRDTTVFCGVTIFEVKTVSPTYLKL